MQILKKQLSVNSYPFTLTQAIIFTLVTTIIVVLLTTYAFLYYEGYAFFDEVSADILRAKRVNIEEVIHDYIDVPVQANAILVHAIGRQSSAAIPVRSLIGEMVNTTNNVFSNKHYLNLVEFGAVNGDFLQAAHGKVASNDYLAVKDARTAHHLTVYSHLTVNSLVKAVLPDYQITQRDWYAAVAKDQSPHWTKPFRDYEYDNEIGVAFSSPAFNRAGQFVGVVASELHLNELNKSLEKFKPHPDSILLIVNESNELISSSVPSLTRSMLAGGKHSSLNLPTLENTHLPVLVAASRILKAHQQSGVHFFTSGNEEYYIDAFPITDRDGLLHWTGIVISPARMITRTIIKYIAITMGMLFIIFSLGLLVVFCGLSRAVKPLRDIVRKAEQLVTHRWLPPDNKRHFPEIASLETTFMALSYQLAESFDAQRREIEEDQPTGLLTRAGLLRQASLYQSRNLLALLHISNMNTVINSLSTEYGEKFISDYILRLRNLLPTNTLIARDKVDKLIVVFPGQTQPKERRRYSELLSSLFIDVKNEASLTANKYVYTGNIGLVTAEIREENIEQTLREAWIALRHAQKQGNGVATFFSGEMHEAELYNIQLHESLHDAIQHHEFHLVLQPIVDLQDQSAFQEGECLLRWCSEAEGEIPPDRFIPLAEESGLIIPLGRWIIEEACRELSAMIRRGAPANFILHINVSAIQLLQQDFAWHLMDVIYRHGLVTGNICLEITERLLMNDAARISRMIAYLRRHGIAVALDDFGVNLSSLPYLHTLSFDSIKIDRRLICQFADEDKAESMIASLIVLAQGFKVPVVAEGIEDEAIKNQLRDLGCQKAQGYLFAHPAPFAHFPIQASSLTADDEQ
ncbi:EAL domain-containing protein [Klebsiella aerogenes]|uniref:EAL domain-containing protein n=1 Tax=Klebsiella aerogenes TaxID=548 RepID=UPI001BD60EF9|nr:EAL domain-containing protein [Klebsiella aerogenes]EKV8808513.1 EAL domain-containing protein [Klebsiella aerogenes]ELJ2005761.1 EAL domain-containing protein [Klebsiella aerogenes]HDS7217710.1 EAL domain-containing protein [Klebsiella aerogenes]HDT4316782.1 EAL domain-containing protein [Klebsiella aerogenes]HEO9305156.1 EAL domain-containing protein [Klebsiella aerogenes]